MFGMDKKPKGKGTLADWEFDLEKQLQNPAESRKINDQVLSCISKLKNMLREGKDKKTFDDAQTLLHGFLAVQKVLKRLEKK